MVYVRRLILCLLLLVIVVTGTIVKAEDLKILKPELGRVIDISLEAQERYKKWEALYSKLMKREIKLEEMTPEQLTLLGEFGEDSGFWSTGTMACSWYCGGGPKKQEASSFLSPQSGNTYIPSNAHDFDLRTAWVEGVKGYGIGEYIEFYFEPFSPRVTVIEIYNGYFKSEKAWEDNSRVKKFKLYVNNKPYAILELEDSRAVQRFHVEPLQSKIENKDLVLKFEIMEVYEGKRWDDVAISEINFDGLDVHCFVKGTQITMADGTTKPIERLKIGDRILTYNIENGVFEDSVVLELAKKTHQNLVELSFAGTTIISTDDHPYYLIDKGWASLNPEKSRVYKGMEKVKHLLIGDHFCSLDENNHLSFRVLKEVNYLNQKEETYTIVRLSRNNNFFANGLLVATEEL